MSGRPSSRKELSTTFKPSIDMGLKGYVQTAEEKTTTHVISQLGFRIPLSSVLPDWAENFSQVIDLSGDLKMGLTTSREKIYDVSKLIDIKKIISRKLRQDFFNKFAHPDPKIDDLQKSWKILRKHVNLTTFVKQEDVKALNDLLLSLYLVGYKNGECYFFNLYELNKQKPIIRILPCSIGPSANSMKVLADQNQLFVCAGAEFGYDAWIHNALKLLLNATGMPVWIPSEDIHAWEYKPRFPDHGWYDKVSVGGYTSSSINGWDLEYDILAPDIYVGHCNSPFLLLKCPFEWGDLFINSTLLASFLPKDKKAKADDIARKLVDNVIYYLEESASENVINNIELPSYGSGTIDYGTEEIETDEAIETLSDFLDEIKIELSDDLIDPRLL